MKQGMRFSLSRELKSCAVAHWFSLQEGPVSSQAVCQGDMFGLTFLCDVMLDHGEDSFCIMDERLSTLQKPILNPCKKEKIIHSFS